MTYSKQNSEAADPLCLRELLGKVEGRQLSRLSTSLAERVNDSKVDSIDGQDVLACKMGGCSMRFLVEVDDDVLTVIDHDGTNICD